MQIPLLVAVLPPFTVHASIWKHWINRHRQHSDVSFNKTTYRYDTIEHTATTKLSLSYHLQKADAKLWKENQAN